MTGSEGLRVGEIEEGAEAVVAPEVTGITQSGDMPLDQAPSRITSDGSRTLCPDGTLGPATEQELKRLSRIATSGAQES